MEIMLKTFWSRHVDEAYMIWLFTLNADLLHRVWNVQSKYNKEVSKLRSVVVSFMNIWQGHPLLPKQVTSGFVSFLRSGIDVNGDI